MQTKKKSWPPAALPPWTTQSQVRAAARLQPYEHSQVTMTQSRLA